MPPLQHKRAVAQEQIQGLVRWRAGPLGSSARARLMRKCKHGS